VKTIYIHGPKTGGTSIRAMLEGQCSAERVYDLYTHDSVRAAVAAAAKSADLISGHFAMGAGQDVPGCQYFASLRNPVERVLSQYWHSRRVVNPDSWTSGAMTNAAKVMGPVEFARSFPVLGRLQCCLLAGGVGGYYHDGRAVGDNELLEMAAWGLDLCAWYSVLDMRDASLAWLNATQHFQIPKLPRLNVSANAEDVSDAELAQIHELCAPDIALLHYAREGLSQWEPKPEPLREVPPVQISSKPQSAVPHIVHIIWFGGDQPEPVARCIAEWRRLNERNDWRIIVHHDDSELLPELRAAYDTATDAAQRSDLLRYSLIARYGGWYVDADMWPVQPMDAVAQFGEPGDRLIVSRQHGHKSGDRLPYANAPIAGAPGNAGIMAVVRRCAEITRPTGRTCWGPEVIKSLVQANPTAFMVIGWPWFFPAAIGRTELPWAAAMGGDTGYLRRCCPSTHGLLPVAIHLWAGGRDTKMPELNGPTVWLMEDSHANAVNAPSGKGKWADGHPMWAIRMGLECAGWNVYMRAPIHGPAVPPNCRAAVVWNGRTEHTRAGVAACAELGIPVWRVENGFFDRRRHAQVDARDILHWASWATTEVLRGPAPDVGRERLAAVLPDGIANMNPCRSGHVLVLGQVNGDTQLADSELPGWGPLQTLVERNLPHGVRAVFRAHPLERITRAPILPPCEAETLAEALADACLVVTINSNSIVEALAAGVPCVAFGPSTAITAGVCARATVATIREDIENALAGVGAPSTADVRRYLEHLACHQYSLLELSCPDFWSQRIGEPQ